MRISIVSILIATTLLTALSGCALVVGGAATGVSMAHDRRTAGTVLDDQSIELSAAKALRADPELRQSAHLNVTSFNNIVLLSGEAPTYEMKRRAGTLVSGIGQVRQVYNEVQIAPPSSLTSRGEDTLITAQAKTSMLGVKGQKDFDITRVKVVTENGVVFLMGLVTRAEAQEVTELVRQVGGVQKVMKLFEYIN